MRATPRVIALCFFLSGATGLVYQVVWLRMLGLVFGHSVHAITTVLAAFMAGLALGSFLFARRAAGIRDLIRAYGLMEIGIGLYCAAIPLLFWLASLVYLGLHRALDLSFAAFTLVQFFLISALLLVPTTLMGGTLPVLSQALVRDDGRMGRTISLLYGINTLGAVTGTILAGYFVLPVLGNRLTVAVAATANVAVGVLAIAYARRHRAGEAAAPTPGSSGAAAALGSPAATADPPTENGPPEPPEKFGSPGAWLTVAALGVSGAVSMVYEVAWSRALALVLGSSTYAFTSMLVAFLVGIAGGSALYGWLWGARHASPATFAWLQLGGGATAAAVVAVFDRFPELFLTGLSRSDSPGFVQLLQLAISGAALLVFTVFIGATFPCAVAVAARSARWAGRDVGGVYAVNTVGAIAGSVLAGFVLIPWLGMQISIKLGIALNLGLAAVLFAASGGVSARRWVPAVAALAGAAGVFALPAWHQGVLTSGPAVYGYKLMRAAVGRSLGEVLRQRGEILFYRDGTSATVAVVRADDLVFLKVNGKTDASNGVDMPTQILLGHVPMLVRPDARRVLVIGLGSGVTASAVARHPIAQLDVVELEPAVVEANRFFSDLNGHVLSDSRVRVLIGDGRNVLQTARQQYDVIISEPSNPWISGLASLFSVEFFDMARQRLAPGGVMVQWIQLYSLPADDLRMIIQSFQTAFPVASVWQGATGDILLVGQTAAAPLDLRQLKRRFEMPAVAKDLARIGVTHWAEMLGYFVLNSREVAQYSGGAALNTDDRLPLEFSAPRALYLDTASANWNQLRRAARAGVPPLSAEDRAELASAEVAYRVGRSYLRRGASSQAMEWFERALQADEQHVPSLVAASQALLALERPAMARDFAQRALKREPGSAAALHATAVALVRLFQPKEAIPLLERAVAIEPSNGKYREALADAAGGR